MARRCPICGVENPPGAPRCEKCKAWLTQTADLGATTKPAAPATDTADPAFVREILELVRTGRKIEAVRIFREATGSGLREAKEAVEAIEAGRQTVYAEGRKPPPTTIEENEILELVRSGNLIAAIKLHRERTGDGLKDSKEAVEALAAAHGIPRPQVGCKAAALMLVVGLVTTVVLGVGMAVFGKVLIAKVFGL